MGIKTIVDKDGEVWMGKEIPSSAGSVAADIAASVLTFGLSDLGGDTTCVTVNGEKHYGKEVKGNK